MERTGIDPMSSHAGRSDRYYLPDAIFKRLTTSYAAWLMHRADVTAYGERRLSSIEPLSTHAQRQDGRSLV